MGNSHIGQYRLCALLTDKPYSQWPFKNLYPFLMATINLREFMCCWESWEKEDDSVLMAEHLSVWGHVVDHFAWSRRDWQINN